MLFMNWAKILSFFRISFFAAGPGLGSPLAKKENRKDDLWSPAMNNCRGKGWMILFVALPGKVFVGGKMLGKYLD